jgi:hypothetical protein
MRALFSVLADLATPALAIAAFAALVACAAGPATTRFTPPRDPDARCPSDLSSTADVPVMRLPRVVVEEWATAGGITVTATRSINGLYVPALALILIPDDVRGWRLDHVIRWERCRVWLHRNTGSPLMAHEIQRGTPDGRQS